MSAQKTPLRTCIGCRLTAGQDQLLRWVLDPRGDGPAVVPDPRRRKSGRGAWLHPDPECAARAVKRRAFPRAFRANVGAVELDELLAAIGLSPSGGEAVHTVQRESGSEI
ncbi:YlxR family protein [Zafaria sp. Z1313]|uniref:YlxR family protein n=1 Tax=unclassified Zafaria TaxID=2828765 RepID=UPI002E770B7D|nr:YlxR family protein [Zafaria sp. J156]MEE1621938.1 YlxR family protein [Zafaria sp. J156]